LGGDIGPEEDDGEIEFIAEGFTAWVGREGHDVSCPYIGNENRNASMRRGGLCGSWSRRRFGSGRGGSRCGSGGAGEDVGLDGAELGGF